MTAILTGRNRAVAAMAGLFPLLFIFMLAACGPREEPEVVDLAGQDFAPEMVSERGKEPLRFAVGAMLVPEKGYSHYKVLLNFVEERIGRPVRVVDRKSYAEVNFLLKEGDVEAAFVCSGPYVDGHEEFGLELLAVPVVYGRKVYYSYVVVHAESPLDNFEDLRGRSFAFTDPNSNTGRLVPTHHLATMGETPESFFKSTTFTYAHDKSIEAVAEKVVDAAAVDSLVWDYGDRVDPRHTSRTKIIWKSAACGIPPVVVRRDLDRKEKEELREVFLTLHESERGREILAGMMIDRFEPGEDGLYDSIREMKSYDQAAVGEKKK